MARVRFATLAAWSIPALMMAASPAHAADIAPSTPAAAIAPLIANASVDAFMAQRRNAPVWYRAGGGAEAAATLSQILRRAPLDGLTSGPQLADAVDAAAQQAATGNPQAIASADRTLSAAWLAYVAALKAPLPGYTYSDPSLTLRVPNPIITLQLASIAPTLAQHLLAVSAVNPIYGPLRDTAWAAMQPSPGGAPDPRLLINLARARILPSTGRYVVVNAANARLTMVENGQVADSMKVVVGKNESQTPMLASTIWYATLNPYWYVPMDLTKNIVAAKMLSPIAKPYWAAKRYEIMSDFGPTPTILPPSAIDWKAVKAGTQTAYLRQLPGKGNAMGKIKFPFPNDIGVYLHDTDHLELMALNDRHLSNGCIRLEDAQRLGRWLMGTQPTTTSLAPEQQVALPRGVPVYLTYITAQPKDGAVAFVADVYGRDRGPALASR